MELKWRIEREWNKEKLSYQWREVWMVPYEEWRWAWMLMTMSLRLSGKKMSKYNLGLQHKTQIALLFIFEFGVGFMSSKLDEPN